jgi:hypothetical protein
MNSDKFIRYEVVYFLLGVIVRRTLAMYIFPVYGMANYESFKDISLLSTKLLCAYTILKPRTRKEEIDELGTPLTFNKLEEEVNDD